MKKHFTLFGVFAAILLGVFMLNMPIMAQGVTTAAMNGTVTDSNGDPLPGANVLIVHSPSGTQFGTTTRTDGNYNLVGLRVGGPYKITVSFVGFKPQESDLAVLQLGQNLRLDFILSEEAVEFSDITVIGEKNTILSSNRTGAGQNISEKNIEYVPTISRSFQEFAKLSPQVSGNSSSIANRSNRYNNIQIDGTQYNDLFGLGATGTPGGQTNTNPVSLDAIQEFQVVVAPYDVKYGGFTGGGINAITRSGTNKWSGSVFGFGRNESLVGNAGFKETDNEFPEFKEYQYGFRLGGPIVKDKLFLFVNGEMTTRDQPLSNISLVTGPANTKELGDQFASILRSKGMEPGTYESFTVEQPSEKVFLRLDLNQSENHRMTLRHNFVHAYRDILADRNANNRLAFNTLAYRIRNITNSTVFQLNSMFSNTASNELILGFTSIRDRRAGISDRRPELRVNETGMQLIAGPDRFSSANELDQDILEFTNNFSLYLGDHVLTIGTHNEFFTFRNLFVRSFFGYYEFNNLTDLQNNTPNYYERAYSRIPGVERPAARFSVNQLGFYIQDEWTVVPSLKFTIGARIDIPYLPTEPGRNDSVSKYFDGIATTNVPSGNLLFSPRFGFNWDIFGDRTSQFRGGVGVFTGRIPYVWMSNNYGNTGTLIAQVNQATGGNVGFSIDPNNQPGVGDPGTGAPTLRSEINLVDPDFKWPQILRFNAAFDQELPWGIIATAEFVYSQAMNDLIYEKLNIAPSTSTIGGNDGRPRYGGTDRKNNNFNDVLMLKNTDEGHSYNISFQLQRNVLYGLSFNTAYTYGVAKDVNSVLSSQALSQIRFNPIDINPNTPALTTSSFDLGHRAFAAVSYTHEFFKNAPTSISFFYNYQSGRPVSFTVSGDLNNDGFNGNDLFYIPSGPDDILLGTVSAGVYTPADPAMYDDLFAFIDNNEYLSENKGKMSERNAARNPWNDVLDMRISQVVPDFLGLGEFQFSLDIINVLNLINTEWGWFETTQFEAYNIVTLRGIESSSGRAVYSFSKPANNTPWSPSDLGSRWQMQLGLRYSF